jgi:4-hydroxybenzoate polyprenyltransferase
MKTLLAFLKLMRWPNLVFIIAAQLLYFFCAYKPLQTQQQVSINLFYLLVVASLTIAAAGYVINDYFDVQIDGINKPEKRIVNTFVPKRQAILLHILLSAIGVAISLYVGYKTKNIIIPIANTAAVILLWFYSTHFKRQLLVGNFIIAALTAWVFAVLYFFVATKGILPDQFNNINSLNGRKLFKITLLFAGFAFITTLIREAVKDIEDEQGDRKYKCNTMPIAWGIPASKVYVAVWTLVVIFALGIIIVYALLSKWYIAAAYVLFLLLAPSLYFLKQLFAANQKPHFSQLSNIIKLIMFFGITALLLLSFNF